MKKILLVSLLGMFATACSDDTETIVNEPVTQNNVLLLKVDYTTQAFEGGKELEFENADGFTISKTFNQPSDFGDITLKYEQTGDTLFYGSIHWNGAGQIYYPENISPANGFTALPQALPLPAESNFEVIYPLDTDEPQDEVPYTALWNAVASLQKVKEYREANPTAKIYLYLYTPSVGFGNPEEWKWIIFIKN